MEESPCNETTINTEINNLSITGSGSGVVGTVNHGASASHQKTKIYTEMRDQTVHKGGVGIVGKYKNVVHVYNSNGKKEVPIEKRFRSFEDCIEFLQERLKLNYISAVNKEYMKKKAKDDQGFPIVHSQLFQIDAEDFYRKSEKSGLQSFGKYLTFEFALSMDPSFVLNVDGRTCVIVGQPGDGKTTTLKRLYVKSAQNKASIFIALAQLQERYSLKSLIITTLLDNYELTEKEATDVYDTLEEHQFDCRVFLDGLDQTNWTVLGKKKNISHTTEISTDQLITNILERDEPGFLRKMKVYATGRHTAVLTLKRNVRPSTLYTIGGLFFF